MGAAEKKAFADIGEYGGHVIDDQDRQMKRRFLMFVGRRRWLGLAAISLGAAYLLLLVHPEPLFAYELRHAGIVVHATRPIPDSMRVGMERVRARLERTALYDPTFVPHVFICEPRWLFALFARTRYRVGGVADVYLGQHVFLRESDMANDRLIGASGRPVASDRPLSYFMVHEIMRAWGYSSRPRPPAPDGLTRAAEACYVGQTGTMATDQDRIRSYYSRFAEWERLDTPEGAIEFRRACSLLDARLPPRSRVLDLGGGPGRYAIKLAMDGHRVVLADISARLLEDARLKIAQLGPLDGAVEAVDEVNATDLSRYPDRAFDAVIAFGPFYHLVSNHERIMAAREVWRVLRAEGLAFVAFIPRLSGVIGLLERAATTPEQVTEETLRAAATTGVFRNASASGFQEGYYPTLDEMHALLETAGFAIVDAVSLRSVASRLESKLSRLESPVVAEVERLMEELGRDPAVIAHGGHAVVVARKR